MSIEKWTIDTVCRPLCGSSISAVDYARNKTGSGGALVDRVEYLRDPWVAAFSAWLAERLDHTASLQHSYINRKSGSVWECDSLYDACIRYF